MFQAHIGLNRKLRISAFLAGAFLFVLTSLALFPLHTKTETTSATTKQSETVMTLSTEDLTLDFEVASVDGSFADDTASVSVTTNNATGYTLSINTSNTGNNAGKLVGENNSFNPISSATTETDFTNSASYNGLWGYKPSVINGAANNSYLPVPTETTTIEETNVPNQEANVYEISLGARADMSYEADTYTNAFIITSVANPVGYTINYNENTEDEVTGMPASQTGSTTASTITLSDATPERENYEFLGWCDGETTTTSNIDSCADTIYQPGDEYEIDHLDDDTETELNAMWKATAQRYTVNYVLGENNTNTVVYKFNPITEAVAYSHTPNITDEGVQNGNYSNNMSTNEVVTIPGATKLHIRLTYAGESTSCDWTSIWAGSHPDYTAAKNYSIGVRIGGNTDGKYGGGSGTTIEGDVETEDGSVTFGFRSDNSVVGFGYYAVITVVEGDGYFYNGEAFSGVYSENVGQNNVFLGWSDTENDTEVVYASEDDIIAAADFGVTNTVNIYPVIGYPTNISFNANGGTGEMNGTTIPYGTTANLPALTYDNYSYKFMGWDTEQEGTGTRYADTAEFTATVQAGENVTLYAQWQEVQIYTVHYVDRGETNTVNYAGWHTGAGDSIHYSHTPNISDEGVQSGNYANNYAMTDVVNIPGATKLHVVLNYGGEGVGCDWASLWAGNHPDYNAYNNYSTGLRLGNNTTGKYGGTQGVVEGDIEGDSVTFAFRSDGSVVGNGYGYYAVITIISDHIKYVYSGAYNLPSDETNVFLGWNTDPEATTVLYANEQELYDTFDGEDEITLYAIWGKPTNISYDANGGNGEMDPISVTYGETVTLEANGFTNSGYKFVKWSTESDGSGDNYRDESSFTATAVKGTNITLHAIWEPIQNYTVNFVDGENTNAVVYECHKAGTANPLYSHTANIADDGTQDGNYENNLNTNEIKKMDGVYKLHVSLNYGTPNSSDYVSLWAGEYPDYRANNNSSAGVKFSGNTNGRYYGTATSGGYIDGDTVTFGFYSNGSGVGYGYYAVVTPGTICSEDEVSGTYSDLSDEDDVFLGWDKNPDATSATYASESAVVQDLNLDDGTTETVYAIWGKPTYVSFDTNGGTGEMDTIQVTYGTTVALPANTFTKENAVFVRWDTQADDGGTNYNNQSNFTATNMRGDNVTLYAIWGEQTIIHFDNNGGVGEMDDMVLTYNTGQNLTQNTFTKENAVFVRWNTNSAGTGTNYNDGARYNANTLAGAEITLYAIWGEPTILTFDPNNGQGSMSSQMIIYSTTENIYANTFTKENAIFQGWNTAADYSGINYTDEQAYTATTLAGANITLYAVWGEQTKFNFHSNGGTGTMAQQVYDYNQTASLNQNLFTRENYEFLAWNTQSDGKGLSMANEQSFTATVIGGETIDLYAIWMPANSPMHEQVNRTTDSGSTPNGITIARAYEIAYTSMGKGMYEETEYGNHIYAEVTDGNYKSYDVRFAMQDMTEKICSSVTVSEDQYQALDTRDNKLYWISKLKDGRCWMTQNLDYDITGPMTSIDSDINLFGAQTYTTNYGYSIDENNVITWTPNLLTIPSTSILEDGSFPDWINDTNDSGRHANSVDVGNWYITGDPTVTSSCSFLKDSCPTVAKQTPFENNGTHGHVGNYYSWITIAASNVEGYGDPCDYSPNGCSSYSVARSPKNSICPKGWRIPYVVPNDSANDEYNKLYRAYQTDGRGDSNLIAGAPYFVRSGAFDESYKSITGAGSNGGYWSSVYLGRWQTYFIQFYSGASTYYDITHQRATKYSQGKAIRCIAY